LSSTSGDDIDKDTHREDADLPALGAAVITSGSETENGGSSIYSELEKKKLTADDGERVVNEDMSSASRFSASSTLNDSRDVDLTPEKVMQIKVLLEKVRLQLTLSMG
jgi:hypothetical protein